jgi:hypothetical protein
MPRPWRSPDDPENLRIVARLLGLHRALANAERKRPGVTRYRSIEEAEQNANPR